jgi:hypothetical protein
MLKILAEKFIKDAEILKKLKELISMGIINEMIATDKAVKIAKYMLKRNTPVKVVVEDTGLPESTILELKASIDAA